MTEETKDPTIIYTSLLLLVGLRHKNNPEIGPVLVLRQSQTLPTGFYGASGWAEDATQKEKDRIVESEKADVARYASQTDFSRVRDQLKKLAGLDGAPSEAPRQGHIRLMLFTRPVEFYVKFCDNAADPFVEISLEKDLITTP